MRASNKPNCNATATAANPTAKTAGAYGIQGLAGARLAYRGQLHRRHGLPLYETAALLRSAGIAVPERRRRRGHQL